MALEYKVKLTGDNSQFERVLKESKNQLTHLTGDEYKVALHYDGNYKELNKTVDKLMGLIPQLDIDFKYNINQQALKNEIKKLSNIEALETDVDFSNIKQELKDILRLSDKDFNGNIEEIQDRIKNLFNLIETGKKLFPDVFSKFETATFTKKLTPVLEKLEKLTNFKINPQAINVDSLKKQINEMQDVVNNLKLEKFFETTKDFNKELVIDNSKALQSIDEVIDKLNELPTKKTLDLDINTQKVDKAYSEVETKINNNVVDSILRMKNPQYHVGNLEESTLKSKDYYPADNLVKSIKSKAIDSIGSGTYYTSNLIEALGILKDFIENGQEVMLYATDFNSVANGMITLNSEEEYDNYTEFLSKLSSFIMNIANITDDNKKYKSVLESNNISNLQDLYADCNEYFTKFNVTIEQLSNFIDNTVDYVKKNMNSVSAKNINTLLQEQLFNVNGVDVSSINSLDNYSVGSVLFDLKNSTARTVKIDASNEELINELINSTIVSYFKKLSYDSNNDLNEILNMILEDFSDRISSSSLSEIKNIISQSSGEFSQIEKQNDELEQQVEIHRDNIKAIEEETEKQEELVKSQKKVNETNKEIEQSATAAAQAKEDELDDFAFDKAVSQINNIIRYYEELEKLDGRTTKAKQIKDKINNFFKSYPELEPHRKYISSVKMDEYGDYINQDDIIKIDSLAESVMRVNLQLEKAQEIATTAAQAEEKLAEAERQVDQTTLSFPTQQFDNEMQQDIVYLENYKNTIEEINKLKIEPQTDEIKKKIEELQKLADYFFGSISITKSQFGSDGANFSNNNYLKTHSRYLKYPSKSFDEIWNIGRDYRNRIDIGKEFSFLHNLTTEFSGISDEITLIESKSEELKNKFAKDLLESSDYVSLLRTKLFRLIEAQEDLKTGFLTEEDDIQSAKKQIDEALEKFPILTQLKDKFSTTDELRTFIRTDNWNDFLSTLPQAHKYLESIGYDFEKISQSDKSDILKPPISLSKSDIDMVLAYIDSMKEISGEMYNEVETVTTALKTLFTSKNATTDFSQYSEEELNGYIKGIIDKLPSVKDSIAEVFEAGLTAGKKAQDSNSPSEKYRELGHDAMDGYCLGIKDKVTAVQSTIASVIRSGFSSSKEIIQSEISNLLNSINGTPIEIPIKVALNNAINSSGNSNLIDIWNKMTEADHLHTATYKDKSVINERSMGISSNTGYIHGEYSYGLPTENNLAKIIVQNAYEQAGEIIDTFMHSHNSGIANMSMPLFNKEGKLLGGDLFAFIKDKLNDGINYQIIKAGNELQTFNTKSFIEDFGKFFKDESMKDNIRMDLANAFSDIRIEISENIIDYIPDYLEQYGDNIQTSLVKNLSNIKMFKDLGLSNVAEEDLIKSINENYDPTSLSSSIIKSILDVTGKYSDGSFVVYKKIFDDLDNKEVLLNNFRNGLEEVRQLALRIETPNILGDYFGEDFDWDKYSTVYKSIEEFRDENPFNWSPDIMNKLFSSESTSDLNNYSTTLSKISNTLIEIRENIPTDLNIGITDEQINSIVLSIEDLVSSFKQLDDVSENTSENIDNILTRKKDIIDIIGKDNFGDALSKGIISETGEGKQKRYSAKESELRNYIQLLEQESEVFESINKTGTEAADTKNKVDEANIKLGQDTQKTNPEIKEETQNLEELGQTQKNISNEEEYANNVYRAKNDLLNRQAQAVEENTKYFKELSETEKNEQKQKEAQLNSQLKKLEELKIAWNDAEAIANSSSNRKNVLQEKAENAKKAYEQLRETISKIINIDDINKIDNITTISPDAQAKVADNKLNQRTKIANRYLSDYEKQLNRIAKFNFHNDTTEELNKIFSKLSQYSDIDEVTEKIDKLKESFISLTKVSLEDKTDDLNKLLSSGKYTEEFGDRIVDILVKIESISTYLNDGLFDIVDSDNISQLQQLDKLISDLKLDVSNKDNKLGNLTKLNKIFKDSAKAINDNSAMSKELKEQFRALGTEAKQLIDLGKPTSSQVEDLNQRLVHLQGLMEEAGKTGKSFTAMLTQRLTGLNAQFIATYFSFYDWVRYMRTAINTVIELDTALTELRKVSDASDSRLSQSFEKSTKTAKELGRSITDVIKSTSDWARLGYTVDQAEELARVTTLYQNVGDNISQEDASQSLVSTLQGFKLAYTDAESVIDKFNEVANNYAIDTAGIGEALQRSAASFNAANTDLSKSIALITATNEVVQDPTSVGTLWKTLSARIRGAKTELEELGEETDDYTETTSKLRDLVLSLTGFDIMLDENTFKDVYDIIVGISDKWNNLTDLEQASLGEALAGKRNANALYAVIGNVETLQKAYKTAENSAGSAQKEQENYQKSIQYSIDTFKASLQELYTKFINADTIKQVVESGKDFVGVLESAGTLLGPIISVLGDVLSLLLKIESNPLTLGLTVSGGVLFKNLDKPKLQGFIKSMFYLSRVAHTFYLVTDFLVQQCGDIPHLNEAPICEELRKSDYIVMYSLPYLGTTYSSQG